MLFCSAFKILSTAYCLEDSSRLLWSNVINCTEVAREGQAGGYRFCSTEGRGNMLTELEAWKPSQDTQQAVAWVWVAVGAGQSGKSGGQYNIIQDFGFHRKPGMLTFIEDGPHGSTM